VDMGNFTFFQLTSVEFSSFPCLHPTFPPLPQLFTLNCILFFFFRSGYFHGSFICVVIVLTIILYCTFRRVGLISFYVFLKVD
jgi:hypothetical protein